MRASVMAQLPQQKRARRSRLRDRRSGASSPVTRPYHRITVMAGEREWRLPKTGPTGVAGYRPSDAGATLIALGVAAVALMGALFFLLLVWSLLRRQPKPLPPARSFFDVIGRRSEPDEAE